MYIQRLIHKLQAHTGNWLGDSYQPTNPPAHRSIWSIHADQSAETTTEWTVVFLRGSGACVVAETN